jgi:hypothetical protein
VRDVDDVSGEWLAIERAFGSAARSTSPLQAPMSSAIARPPMSPGTTIQVTGFSQPTMFS